MDVGHSERSCHLFPRSRGIPVDKSLTRKWEGKNSMEVLLVRQNLDTEIRFWWIEGTQRMLDSVKDGEKEVEPIWVIDKLELSPRWMSSGPSYGWVRLGLESCEVTWWEAPESTIYGALGEEVAIVKWAAGLVVRRWGNNLKHCLASWPRLSQYWPRSCEGRLEGDTPFGVGSKPDVVVRLFWWKLEDLFKKCTVGGDGSEYCFSLCSRKPSWSTILPNNSSKCITESRVRRAVTSSL